MGRGHDEKTFNMAMVTNPAGERFVVGAQMALKLSRETYNLYRSIKSLTPLVHVEIAVTMCMIERGIVRPGSRTATLVPFDFASVYIPQQLAAVASRKQKKTHPLLTTPQSKQFYNRILKSQTKPTSFIPARTTSAVKPKVKSLKIESPLPKERDIPPPPPNTLKPTPLKAFGSEEVDLTLDPLTLLSIAAMARFAETPQPRYYALSELSLFRFRYETTAN
jgi:hypothetical protein